MRKSTTGFTIVELLIVIVVIGILAAITVVAYNGVQQRAAMTKQHADLSSIKKALDIYYIEHESYPLSVEATSFCDNSWCGWDQATGDGFIPGLSPTYMSTIPQMDTNLPKHDTYLYQSDGVYYQLIRFRGAILGGLADYEMEGNDLLLKNTEPGEDYEGYAWGYKSDPAKDWK